MPTSNFQVRYETPSAGQNIVLLSGAINEHCKILDVRIPTLPPDTTLCIDTGGVTAINSIGVRDFATWSRLIKGKDVTISRCPKIFIDQLNMLLGFIPTHSTVTSFYVPFCTEDAANTEPDYKHVLYTSPANFRFENGKVVVDHVTGLRDKNGHKMELDVVPEMYFRFLEIYCPKKVVDS